MEHANDLKMVAVIGQKNYLMKLELVDLKVFKVV